MSEESKTAESDYVMMGSGSGVRPGTGTTTSNLGLDDPSLSLEEKDHRLALAMQQQENAAAYDEHKKKHDTYSQANQHRTARSATFTKLAAVRAKDHGMLTVPPEYTSENAYKADSGDYNGPTFVAPPPGADPQEIADFELAAGLQKLEQVDAGTVRTMQKIVTEEATEESAQAHRTERSNYHIPQKGLPFLKKK
ncbi:hypothetical protein MPSEU_000622400 [Mayamaea pseudoterrestris]|nr:hypothetical protein MPSEU_000622400 [Mayamaea pseudoterrestris]